MRDDLFARHGEHAERIVVAQVGLDREREMSKVLERFQVARASRPWHQTPSGSAPRCRTRAASDHCRRVSCSARISSRLAFSMGSSSSGRGRLDGIGGPPDYAVLSECGPSITWPLIRALLPRNSGDGGAVLVRDIDVVDAVAAGQACARGRVAVSTSPARAGARNSMVQPCGDRNQVVAVAGKRERAVGQRKDESAVAGRVAVHHVVAHASWSAWRSPERPSRSAFPAPGTRDRARTWHRRTAGPAPALPPVTA